MRPFTDSSLSLLIRFSPSTLFVAEQITRSSENLSFIITRNICDIFLSSAQASTVLLVSISRLKKPVCSFESDEMETGFLSGNPEAFISRNVNEARLARRKGQPKIYPPVGIRQYWLAEFRQLVLNSMQSIRIKFEVTSKSILRRGKVNGDTRVTLRV